MEWLNYHHLYYFWTAAREGSMTKAAQKMHVTPATLSIQIRELEKSAGCQLLKKSGRGIALTDMGETVYRYACDIFALGEELKGAVRGQPAGNPLLLRVGVKDAMPKLLAYKFLEKGLGSDQPIRVVCREGEVDKLVSELAVHRLDVVLSDTPLDPSLKFRVYSHLLEESTVTLVGAPKLASRYRKNFPESLHQAPFILPTADTVLRRNLDQWFTEMGIKPTIRGEFEDAAMLKIAGESGMGIFGIPTMILSEVSDRYGVRVIGETPIIERYYALSVERKIEHPAVLLITH
ncbi:transcriptional activator NhaR [Pirellulaceae bacterium SH467]|jgi:LysR family transcriptional activator of nhaA